MKILHTYNIPIRYMLIWKDGIRYKKLDVWLQVTISINIISKMYFYYKKTIWCGNVHKSNIRGNPDETKMETNPEINEYLIDNPDKIEANLFPVAIQNVINSTDFSQTDMFGSGEYFENLANQAGNKVQKYIESLP